jgi:hypothetical protein
MVVMVRLHTENSHRFDAAGVGERPTLERGMRQV